MNKKYQVFTPFGTVLQMFEYVGYEGEAIIDSKILDLSCGDGAFLCCALKRYIVEAKKKQLTNRIIKEKCNQLFYGFEIDRLMYDKCITNLNDIIANTIGGKIGWDNIKCSDGLNIEISDFDFVFGNPPYISYGEMTKDTREYLKNNFISCKNDRFDYSYAFIEKSISCLKESGKAIVIAPINMYRMKSAKHYREFVADYLVSLYDVSYDNIFSGVLTNPAISLFYKKKINDCFNYYCKGESKVVSNEELLGRLIFKKNDKQGRRFGDYFKVSCAIATLLNKVFILDCNKNGDVIVDNLKLETEVIKNAVSPKLDHFKSPKGIIFPYHFVNGVLTRYSEKEFSKKFPIAYSYLCQHKDELLKRDADATVKWFEYGRSQALIYQNQDKVMVNAIITKNFSTRKIGPNDIPFAGYYIVPKDPNSHSIDEAINILDNENVLSYLQSVGVKMNGNSFRYSPKDLEDYLF